jgi:hypothetical protein
MSFDIDLTLSGPLRSLRQMLADQTYDGHVSLHDDGMAQGLGFKAALIEGPTHLASSIPCSSNSGIARGSIGAASPRTN